MANPHHAGNTTAMNLGIEVKGRWSYVKVSGISTLIPAYTVYVSGTRKAATTIPAIAIPTTITSISHHVWYRQVRVSACHRAVRGNVGSRCQFRCASNGAQKAPTR